MRQSLTCALALCGLFLQTDISAAQRPAPARDCMYAGKAYSLGAFLCVSKGMAMVCGTPAVLETKSPHNGGPRGKPTDGAWQLVQQNNDLVSIQGDPSRTCDINPSLTPQ
jgi:hypothetical protein